MMPCSTTVVQDAVNIEVVGSNPTGAVRRLTVSCDASFGGSEPNKNPYLESWPSGLRQRFTKPPRVKILRGFESLRFRFT